jgi:selenide,water dikinase
MDDAIILTKPIGTGIMSTAIKAGLAEKSHIKESVAVMSMLNRSAAEVSKESSTGFLDII